MVLLVLAANPVQAADGVALLKQFLKDVQAGEGRFEQRVSARSGRVPQLSRGSFAFQRPGRFRWVYEAPYPQTLVGDGVRLWSYDPDLNQVSVQRMDGALGRSPAALLAGDEVLDNFTLVGAGEAAGLFWVDAHPIGEASGFSSVRLGFEAHGAVLRTMILEDQFGQRTELQLSDFKVSPSLPPARFVFEPPAGADVVGDTGAER